MTYIEAKEKLHLYIEQADEQKISALLSFVESDLPNATFYDEATLNMLRERSAEYKSGSSATYGFDESMARVNARRKKNGV